MKRLLLLILFIISAQMYGQNVYNASNSSNTVLGSSATFTPSSWATLTNYNSVTVTIVSNSSSAANGVRIKFATLTGGVYRIVDSTNATYTAGSLFKLTLPITAPYLKIIYTNSAAVQTSFSLVTMLSVGQQLNLDSNGNLNTTLSGGSTGGGYNKVTSTGGDSLAATETSYWRPTIRAVDDTVAYSQSRTYPSTDLNILYPGQSYTYINMDVATMPKLYFKTFGTGTPTVQLKHEGR